jgi:hypothetical protein
MNHKPPYVGCIQSETNGRHLSHVTISYHVTTPWYPLDRGLVGHRAGLDTKKRTISCPCRKLNPGRPAHSPSLYRLRYPGSLHKYLVLTLSNLRKPPSISLNTNVLSSSKLWDTTELIKQLQNIRVCLQAYSQFWCLHLHGFVFNFREDITKDFRTATVAEPNVNITRLTSVLA